MRTALVVAALTAGAGASIASAAPVELAPKPGALAGNGRLAAFPATASELCVGQDTDRRIFIRDLSSGEFTPAARPPGTERHVFVEPSLSSDGRRLAFRSFDSGESVWLQDRDPGGTSTQLAKAFELFFPVVSGDGSTVAWGVGSSIQVKERDATTETIPGYQKGSRITISANGQSVAWLAGGSAQVRDRVTNTTQALGRYGPPSQTPAPTGLPDFTADGGKAAFVGGAALSTESGGHQQAYVRDLRSGGLTLVSRGGSGTPADAAVADVRISTDGRYVVFSSAALNLGAAPDGDQLDIFVRDLQEGKTTVVDTGPGGVSDLDASDSGKLVTWKRPDGAWYGTTTLGEVAPWPAGGLADPCAPPPASPLPRLVARVTPSRVRAGQRSCLRVSARTEGGRRIANARLRLGSTRVSLGKRGSRRLCLRFRKAGVRKLTVSARGYRTARLKIRVLPARR